MKKITLAANWKMYLDESSSIAFIDKLNADKDLFSNKDIILFPSHACIRAVKDRLNVSLSIGMQDCDMYAKGAYTGSTSINSIDIDSCIVGHSERRIVYKESDEMIFNKVKSLLNNGLTPIFCCGESLDDRNNGIQFDVVNSQLSNILNNLSSSDFEKIIIAYEPVWAIGTGLTAEPSDAQAMHSYIRNTIANKFTTKTSEQISILYGGSCKPANSKELFSMKDIDGGLIGGASLDSNSFLAIVNSF